MAIDPNSPLTNLNGSETVSALQNGLVNTAKGVGNDAVNGVQNVAGTTLNAVTDGDKDNPFLFYAGLAGKAGGAAAGAAVTTTVNAAQNIGQTALDTSRGLLGDLTRPTQPNQNAVAQVRGGRNDGIT